METVSEQSLIEQGTAVAQEFKKEYDLLPEAERDMVDDHAVSAVYAVLESKTIVEAAEMIHAACELMYMLGVAEQKKKMTQ